MIFLLSFSFSETWKVLFDWYFPMLSIVSVENASIKCLVFIFINSVVENSACQWSRSFREDSLPSFDEKPRQDAQSMEEKKSRLHLLGVNGRCINFYSWQILFCQSEISSP